jgi:hypothetical protein
MSMARHRARIAAFADDRVPKGEAAGCGADGLISPRCVDAIEPLGVTGVRARNPR